MRIPKLEVWVALLALIVLHVAVMTAPALSTAQAQRLTVHTEDEAPDGDEGEGSGSSSGEASADFDKQFTYDRFDIACLDNWKDADKKTGLVKPYTGPMKDHPTIKQFLKDLPGLRRTALKRQREFFGIPKDFDPVVLFILCDPPEGPKAGTYAMQTSDVEKDGRTISYVRVYTHDLISRKTRYTTTVEHEINHALGREYLGDNYYGSGWLSEGLAVYASGQIPERAATLLAGKLNNARTANDAANIVHDLTDGWEKRFTTDDYIEAALHVDGYIAYKPSFVHELIKRLKQGEKPDAALNAILNLQTDERVAFGRNYARRRLAELEGGHFLQAWRAQNIKNDADRENDAAKKTTRYTVLRNFLIKQLEEDRKEAGKGPLPYSSTAFTWILLKAHMVLGEHEQALKLAATCFDEGQPLQASTMTYVGSKYAAQCALASKDPVAMAEWGQRMYFGFGYNAEARKLGEDLLTAAGWKLASE